MPEIIPVLRNIIGGLLQYLTGQQLAGGIDAAMRMITAVNNAWAATTNADVYVRGQEYGAWKFSQHRAEEAGNGFGTAAYNQNIMWTHMLWTILPNSLSWLNGHIVQWFFEKIWPTIQGIRTDLNNLRRFTLDLSSYVYGWVTTYVNLWVRWYNAWHEAVQNVTSIWQRWFARPGEFASWATPPLAGSLVAYYADPSHGVTRDNLSLTMTQAWAEVPNRTWEAILRWSVTES